MHKILEWEVLKLGNKHKYPTLDARFKNSNPKF